MLNPIPRVVDLSHYDDVQDKFAGAKAFGIWGVINKVTESVSVRDKSFDWRRGPAKEAGLLYGAYHFLRPGRIEQQATWFLQNVGDPTGLLLALDHEDKRVPLSDARHWMEAVHSTVGRWPILYSGNVVKEQLGNTIDPFWANIKLWLAQYGANPKWPKTWQAPFLIQYTGDGVGPAPHNVPGIVIHGNAGIDINHYAGTLDQLTQEWTS